MNKPEGHQKERPQAKAQKYWLAQALQLPIVRGLLSTEQALGGFLYADLLALILVFEREKLFLSTEKYERHLDLTGQGGTLDIDLMILISGNVDSTLRSKSGPI